MNARGEYSDRLAGIGRAHPVSAAFQTRMTDGTIVCGLCPRHCRIRPGQTGFCGTRRHDGDELIAINYGQVIACHLDPIEKKPLYTFHPGSRILSVGTFGCNFACPFCQNHSLSMWRPHQNDFVPSDATYVPPEELVRMAKKTPGNIGLAFTYNEPTIWYEYVRDCAPLLKQDGMKLVLVTNGYIEPEPLKQLLPFIDAMNIDLKTIDREQAIRMNTGDPEDVLRTIELASRACVVEVTTLMVTELSDDPSMIERLAKRLALIDPQPVLHLSRYFPAYKYHAPPTSIERLKAATAVARRHLDRVHAGNCPPGLVI